MECQWFFGVPRVSSSPIYNIYHIHIPNLYLCDIIIYHTLFEDLTYVHHRHYRAIFIDTKKQYL